MIVSSKTAPSSLASSKVEPDKTVFLNTAPWRSAFPKLTRSNTAFEKSTPVKDHNWVSVLLYGKYQIVLVWITTSKWLNTFKIEHTHWQKSHINKRFIKLCTLFSKIIECPNFYDKISFVNKSTLINSRITLLSRVILNKDILVKYSN